MAVGGMQVAKVKVEVGEAVAVAAVVVFHFPFVAPLQTLSLSPLANFVPLPHRMLRKRRHSDSLDAPSSLDESIRSLPSLDADARSKYEQSHRARDTPLSVQRVENIDSSSDDRIRFDATGIGTRVLEMRATLHSLVQRWLVRYVEPLPPRQAKQMIACRHRSMNRSASCFVWANPLDDENRRRPTSDR